MHNVAVLRRLEGFGFSDGILRPVEIGASEVGALGGEGDGRLFRLVEDIELVVLGSSGIDFGTQGIDGGEDEEAGGFDDPVPVEWIRERRIGGNPRGIGALVRALGPDSVGRTVKLSLSRGGEPEEASLTIGERPEA